MTITDFLLARITEDEAAARDCEQVFPLDEPFGLEFQHDHQSRWTPARVLAECEAKRRIVEEHSPTGPHACTFSQVYATGHADDFCGTLRALASVYADHVDHCKEWQ